MLSRSKYNKITTLLTYLNTSGGISMVKIVNIGKEVKGEIGVINLFGDRNILFLEQGENISIVKFNYKTKKADRLKFDKPINLFSCINSTEVMYYSNIDKFNSKYRVNIYKMDCNNLKNCYISEFNTEFESDNENHFDSLSLYSRLIGLNDRYVIFLLPCIQLSEPFFHKALLIDSVEKRVYKIPDSIGCIDTILRVDQVFAFQKGEYIILKTGRIGDYEKRQIWEQQKQKGEFTEYHSSLEDLVICKVSEFADNVKHGIPIDKDKIVQTCDLHEGLRIIGNYEDKIIYSIQSFDKGTTDIKIYYVGSHRIKTITVEGFYDNIKYSNGKFYGFMQNNGVTNIYDIITKDKIFSSKGWNVHIVDENFITLNDEFIDDKFKSILEIYNFNDKNKIDGMEFNSCCFDYERNTLIVL
ncbi:hypothetical protein N072000002_02240 [Clostridium tetani]|uniref:EF-hand domain-containing protein n=3 Tax=Clostridium tetani TaxID=1513 RepID=A0ABC8E9V1_CLOTA|nr:hypothetical protein K234311028_02230 [Clostridium tetani]BDR88423.1 hypothetical protein N072000002_02240 [Clostridium tetani]